MTEVALAKDNHVNRRSRKDDQDQPVIVPKAPLRPRLIEDGPVVIPMREVQSISEAAEAP